MNEIKTAIITGSGTGIGRATALKLAELGCNIIVNYSRSEKEAHETSVIIKQLGMDCLIYKADVSNDQEVRGMIEAAIKTYGRIDYVVNNAGMTNFVEMPDLEGLKDEYWDNAFNVNVKGMFNVSRAAAPYLKKTNGSIVNVTSIAGLTGRGSSIAYAASKAAAISVTKSLALVLAPEIRVNSIAPGVVLTRWVAGNDKHIEKMSSGTPLGKVCESEDVAELIVDTLTKSALVTGQTIVIDGGFTI